MSHVCCARPPGSDHRYIYTHDLPQLEGIRSSATNMDPELSKVHTPLSLEAWRRCLQVHPDKDFADYILRGIERGFRIGANPEATLTSTNKNMQSAKQHPDVINQDSQ